MAIAQIHEDVFGLLMKYHKQHPDSFFFSFRQLNRNNRLDKGYWFLGNDHYLAISFWTGKDPVANIPIIAFIIHEDGTTYLEINFKNYNNKAINFREALLSQFSFSYEPPNGNYRKPYEGFGTDYLKALDNFILTDKEYIDNIVREYGFRGDTDGYHDQVGFIWRGEFARQLKIIEYYRDQYQAELRHTGYLCGFKIKRFGPLANIAITGIPKGCRWIFLTGENGSGKSTVLRALAAALLNNNDQGTKIAEDFEVAVDIEAPFDVNRINVYGVDAIENKQPIVKGFAAYGPIRLVTQSSLDKKHFSFDGEAISQRATFGLFNTIGILKDASTNIYFPATRPKYQRIEYDNLLDSISANLPLFLPGIAAVELIDHGTGQEVRYYSKTQDGSKGQSMGFKQLSSGTQNYAALILDLMIRFGERQDAVDISNFVGIVLIDEIDLHLHPKMQKEMVIQLASTFPNIQFIVSTHSPIPMLGAPENSVFINLHRDEQDRIQAAKINIDITNLLPNTILTSPIFGFDELINISHNEKERIVTEDSYSDALFYEILERKIRENSITPGQKNDSPA